MGPLLETKAARSHTENYCWGLRPTPKETERVLSIMSRKYQLLKPVFEPSYCRTCLHWGNQQSLMKRRAVTLSFLVQIINFNNPDTYVHPEHVSRLSDTMSHQWRHSLWNSNLVRLNKRFHPPKRKWFIMNEFTAERAHFTLDPVTRRANINEYNRKKDGEIITSLGEVLISSRIPAMKADEV